MGTCCFKKKEPSFVIIYSYSLKDSNIKINKYNQWYCHFCKERITDNFLTIVKCIHCDTYIGHASCLTNSWPSINHEKENCPFCNR